MVDVRRLKMLQMVQLFKCEEDALQVRCTTAQEHMYMYGCMDELMTCVCVCVFRQ